MPLDLKNPGAKEMLLVGGGALGLGLLYMYATKGSKKATTPATSATPATTASDGAPFTQSFLPGGQSQTGNALTDAAFTSPVTPSPGTGIAGQAQNPFPTFTPRVATPVRHASQGAESILGGVGGGGGISGGAPSGGSITNLSGTSPLQWATSVLKAGGFPTTAANLQSLVAWALNEGGGGANNPLNTTQPASGASNFNSIGVKNYPSVATGVSATVATLGNGLYSTIVSDLKSGLGIGSNAASELSKWSGGGYSSLSGNWARAAGLIKPPVTAKPNVLNPGTKALTPSQVSNLFPTVKENPLASIVANAKGFAQLAAAQSAAKAKAKPKAKPKLAKSRLASVGKGLSDSLLTLDALFRPTPKPKAPAYRPVPLRGPGHPLLH